MNSKFINVSPLLHAFVITLSGACTENTSEIDILNILSMLFHIESQTFVLRVRGKFLCVFQSQVIIKIGSFWGAKERPWKMTFRHGQKVWALVIEFSFNKLSFGGFCFFLTCMFYG